MVATPTNPILIILNLASCYISGLVNGCSLPANAPRVLHYLFLFCFVLFWNMAFFPLVSMLKLVMERFCWVGICCVTS